MSEARSTTSKLRRAALGFQSVELFPLGLGIGEMHRPFDLGVRGRDLSQDLALVVVGEKAEARGLALDPAVGIAISSARPGMHSRAFRPDKEFIRAVAEARDADGGMNLNGSDS